MQTQNKQKTLKKKILDTAAAGLFGLGYLIIGTQAYHAYKCDSRYKEVLENIRTSDSGQGIYTNAKLQSLNEEYAKHCRNAMGGNIVSYLGLGIFMAPRLKRDLNTF